MKQITTIGKRKKAVAMATVSDGTGRLTLNKMSLSTIEPENLRLRLEEPLRLSNGLDKKVDIKINTKGGGTVGQITAARQAIAKAFVRIDKSLKEKYISYDRSMLVYDPRRNEPSKESHSSWGPRRKRQSSKR